MPDDQLPVTRENTQAASPPSRGDMVRLSAGGTAEYDGTCLRPLGLCELGGACDVCWYRPDHPRFKGK
jgi:hypothetical protein